VDGVKGKSFTFDGQDDYIAFSEAIFGPSVNGFTFSAWIQTRDEDYTVDKLIIYKGCFNGEAALGTINNGFSFAVKLSDGKWYEINAPMVKNANVHLVGVYRKGDHIELYVDGTPNGYVTVPFLDLFTQGDHFSSVGAYSQGMYHNEARYWDSVIDEVRIYNRALSASEVEQVFFLGVGAAPLVSEVRASQRPGTMLVDLFYDLSGAGSNYSVSVTVSSDGGASFSAPATHFTGDGVTSAAAPGAARHIVWDAGADSPGQFCTKMRFKLVTGSPFALSPIFTLDTRVVPTGTLTGLVEGAGTPVANAQARIDGTGFAASTGADGRFTLANVPAGSGYLLKVSAAGFASRPVPGISVTSGTKGLGTIQLAPLAGPYRLVPLQPDVNPPVTQIEDGGVGYRYYRLIPVNANDNLGGVTVSLRVAGGSTISQAGDVSDAWAGRTAGVSDDDGIVRLRIPASAIGGGGASATLEVLESGIVKATFLAQVAARQYEQVWKHEWEGELGRKLTLSDNIGIIAATHQTHETTVARPFGSAEPSREIVGRTRDDEFKGRVSLGNSVRVGRTGGGATEGLGGAIGVSLGTSFYFSPDTTDPTDNLMKLYAAFADDLDLVPMGGQIIGMIQQEIERVYLANQLESTTAAIRGAGHVEASAGFGGAVPWSDELAVYAWADVSTDVGLEVGLTDHLGRYLDYYAELAGNVQIRSDSKTPGGTAVHIFVQPGGAVRATVRFEPSGQRPQHLILESKLRMTTDTAQSVPGWPDNDLIQLLPLETAEYQYRYTLPVPGGGDIPAVAQSAWNSVRNRGQGSVFTVGQPMGWLSGMLAAGGTVGYQNRVYSADVVQANLLNIDLAGIQFQLQGQMERGAELTKESGVLWQGRRMGLEKYSDFPRQYYPSENIFDLERRWAGYALDPINSYLNRAEALVAGVGDTVVQVGSGAAHAVLQFGQGVMAGASKIVTEWIPGLASPGGGQFARAYARHGLQSKDGGTATNLVYGIGGIYRFESTNSFNGTGMLTIAYSPGEVSGLNPADLRIYRLPDGTNRWQLVGGTVDVASNTVTAVISQLGTYTVAPPMPTGDLQLTPSTNTLAADGPSEMTVVVTNILLNTGEVLSPPPYVGGYSGSATQQWTFTATAMGLSILNQDVDTNTPGVQVLSTNGAVTLFLCAPVGGTVARVNLASVVGDAFGSVAVNLLDNTPPATPTGVSVTAGQSRIWVSWQTSREPDLAGCRVYYRLDASGPPWDGTAAVEGLPSPVMVTRTNCLLRGLALGTNYFVAVSAVDTTGNESPLSAAIQVTTAPGPPMSPTGLTVRFGADGTNILMWALSEDDGYNDRDVALYEVWRAVLPGGEYLKVGEVAAGIGVFSDGNVVIQPGQYVSYAVTAVASGGASSAAALATSLVESPLLNVAAVLPDGSVRLSVTGLTGLSYTVQASTNLVVWTPVTTLVNTNGTMTVVDPAATNFNYRFYRAVSP
jgi:hypothetical protein